MKVDGPCYIKSSEPVSPCIWLKVETFALQSTGLFQITAPISLSYGLWLRYPHVMFKRLDGINVSVALELLGI